jgi:SAM-dependent methyltransferase
VREGYAKIATGEAGSCCAPEPASSSSCCGGTQGCGSGATDFASFARAIGYSSEELEGLPEGANLGLSCGNPTALAELRPGEVVLDLGSGAGFDVLIAARKVGPEGRVIGVDMTPEMLSKARSNASTIGARNVEFRLGEIENLPVADGSVDVVISNCVINLSPDKPRVFREIARVLKPGGRAAISDMALLRPLPDAVRADLLAYVGCVAGAVAIEDYERDVREAGLADVGIEIRREGDPQEVFQDPLYQRVTSNLASGETPSDYIASIAVSARKPR